MDKITQGFYAELKAKLKNDAVATQMLLHIERDHLLQSKTNSYNRGDITLQELLDFQDSLYV